MLLELMCWPALKTLGLLLPMNVLPELSFLAIVLLFFVSIDFILTVVSVLSVYAHFTHILIALTVIAWGSSPIELINLVIANRKGELQMGLTSILSGIVLAFYILMPFAMIFKMLRRHSHEIQILQPIHSSHLFMLPALVVTVITLLIYWKTSMRIGKMSASALILTYIGYIVYMGYML